MGEKLSKVSLPNSAGTIITYEFKDRYAADTRITEEDLALIFNKNLSTEDELAGTWLVNSGWSCPAGYGFWTFNGYTQKVGTSSTWSTSSGIFFGYEETLEFMGTAKENAILVGYDIYGHLYPQDSFYLVIEEAPEDNNGKLSNWLKANATKQGATSLIAFTIAGTSYQAEDSMTWAEWCDSDYNTDGYKVSNNYVTFDLQNYYVTDVSSNDTIKDNRAYSLTFFGIGGGGSN